MDLPSWRALDAKGLLLATPSTTEGSNHGSAPPPPPPPRGVLGMPMLMPTSTLTVGWNVFIHAFDAIYTTFVLPVTIAFSAHSVRGALGVSSTVAGMSDILPPFTGTHHTTHTHTHTQDLYTSLMCCATSKRVSL